MLLLWLLLAPACGGDDDDVPLKVAVRAEVVEQDAPVDVEATAVDVGQKGWFMHGVNVTWRGADAARLDDARFVNRIEGGSGTLVTLGRGCGYSVDESTGELMFPCTEDLQLIVLQPGETHEYPVSIPPKVGSVRLGPGTYVVDEVIHWYQPADFAAQPAAEGQFTVRLTYDVSKGD